jgi:uncharacterized protein YqgQ
VNSIYDVRQLLKKFGTFIYIGDRIADMELMEAELKELYRSQLIETKDYQMGILLVRQEAEREKEKEKEKQKNT